LGRIVKITKTKGFSLIELMIVIAVIGIMAGIASLSWQRYVNNANLRTAARGLATDINLMKARAISKTDTNYTMVFDRVANTYTLNGTAVEIKLLTPPDQPSASTFIFSLPSGGPTETLIFQARGTLIPAGGTIELRNNIGSRAIITYNFTGKTHVTFIY
jgi:prepilin-type N-terminal cleavage/methylation domain-containing protein